MRKIYSIFIALIALVLTFFVLNSYVYYQKQSETVSVKLYYYNPLLDQGEGGVQCTEKGLVEVKRQIPKTQTPLFDTIELLIKGELTSEEKVGGLQTEFPLEGLSLESANIQNEIVTLEFFDPNNKTVGGSCRTGILQAQIQKTAKQFQNVKEVRFLPEDLFQP